jgi:ribosomal protein S18 acetylase RimI-like enzyme
MRYSIATFRRTRREDIPVLKKLYNQLHQHHREIRTAREWIAQPDEAVTEYFGRTLEKQIDDENVFMLTALLDERIVGFVRVTKRTIEGFSEEHAYMDPMMVAPEIRGQGIGTELFRRGIEWGDEQNLGSIWLDVWEENVRARKMYEREGWRTVSRTMALKY